MLGPEHPNTLTIMQNLARTYSDQGGYKEAEVLQLKVMDLAKKVLGLAHPRTLCRISDLATTYVIQRKHKEAEKLQMVMSNSGNPANPEN